MRTSRLTAGVMSRVMSPSAETCGVMERTVPTVIVWIDSLVVITGGVPGDWVTCRGGNNAVVQFSFH